MAVLPEVASGVQHQTRSMWDSRLTRRNLVYTDSRPCWRGHYSDAVLSSLESQNDAEVEGISAKVKMLKDVSKPGCTPVSFGDKMQCFEVPIADAAVARLPMPSVMKFAIRHT